MMNNLKVMLLLTKNYFVPGINCGTHSDICINVTSPVTNPLLHGKNLQSNNVSIDNDLFCSHVNCVPHSYNSPSDVCINACTTDMNAVLYDKYHASDDVIVNLLQVPIMCWQ